MDDMKNNKKKINANKAIKKLLLPFFTPSSAFQHIKNKKLNYLLITPFMLFWGCIWLILHVFIVRGDNIFLEIYAPYAFLTHAAYSLGLWIVGSLGFYFIARLFKKKVGLHQIERAVLHLWVVWALMPLMDIPHLLLPTLRLAGVVIHFSWIPAFILVIRMSYYIFRDVLHFSRTELKYAAFMSLSLPLFGRFFLEEIPNILTISFDVLRGGAGLNYWHSAVISVIIVASTCLAVRQFILTKKLLPLKFSVAISLFMLTTAFLFVNPPLTITKTGEFGLGMLIHTGSETWYSTDYETGTVTLSSYNGGSPQNKVLTTDYQDVVDFNFTPNSSDIEITWIKCIVHFTSNTVDGNTGDGFPRARCSLGTDTDSGMGTIYDGDWWTDLNGAGNQSYTWDSNSPDWTNILNGLTQNNNDLRTRLETHGFDDTSTDNNDWWDVVEYDGIWLQVHYNDVSNATVDLTKPTTNINVEENDTFELECQINCTNEDTTCDNIVVYVRYCSGSMTCTPNTTMNTSSASPLYTNVSNYSISSMSAGSSTTRTFNVTGRDRNEYTVGCKITANNPSSYDSPTTRGVNVTNKAPYITIISPTNRTYDKDWVWANVSLDESGDWCGYSLDGNANVSMTRYNLTYFYSNVSGLSEGQHNIIFYCNDTEGAMRESNTVYFTYGPDTNPPTFSNIQDSPDPTGYDQNITIEANVTDPEDNGIDVVNLEITYPNSNKENFTMINISEDRYQYNFSNTWQKGTYSYKIWANDSLGNLGSSSSYTFNVVGNASFVFYTVSDSYGPAEDVNLVSVSNWTSSDQESGTQSVVGINETIVKT
ncbi:MAG: YIP1 family protein, partial [Candidatus Aenigmarchaeota archaeon]|nr:YIP1 family protein [Candidatus Aenigmarchaeota archaeon]